MDGFETHVFSTDGSFPNSRLPVLIYRAALAADAEAMIRAFAANVWIDGIFPYHHFHSIAHEALGIAAGSVDVLRGGPSGRPVRLDAGDVVVIPAGVAHRNVDQRGTLRVVGAYPGGADYDLCRGLPEAFAAAARAAEAVSPMVTDPVDGGAGRLAHAWASPTVSS